MKIGIIGAGFVGRAVAKLAIKAGHSVMLSNSRTPQTLFSLIPMIGCEIGTARQAAAYGDIVVIAVPLMAIDQLPVDALYGKQVIDVVNYYHERDGQIEALESKQTTTSEMVARLLANSRVTKAFNAIPMTQLESDGLPAGSPQRRALPIAGDDTLGKKIASELYDAFGFDCVDAGGLEQGWRFERGMPAYCVPMTKDELILSLESAVRHPSSVSGAHR